MLAAAMNAGEVVAVPPGAWDPYARWLIAVIAAAATGLALHALVVWIIGRIGRRTHSSLGQSLAEHARWPARAVFVLLTVQIAQLAMRGPMTVLSPSRHVVALALIASAAWLAVRLSRVADYWVGGILRGNGVEQIRSRRVRTRVRVVRRVFAVAVWVVAASAMLMTFPKAWQLGASLLASAGIAGLVAGIAARPLLANLIAGVQIALTQPIRLEDAVMIDDVFGWVEEITATYVVLRTRDSRRVIVPVTFFVERSYENWTRSTAAVVAAATVVVDRAADVERLRTALRGIVERSGKWDGRTLALEVANVLPAGLELRATAGTLDAAHAWDLQGEMREGLMAFVRAEQEEKRT